MKKLCLLGCLLVSSAVNAQTAPKVAFIGDDLTAAWQGTTEFHANKNWIGDGLVAGYSQGSGAVLADLPSVLNQHPAFVHIMVGLSDASVVKDSLPLGVVFGYWQSNIVQTVAMAKKANVKVILGNLIFLPPGGGIDPEAISFMNVWLDAYGRANNIPVVNYNAAFCQCVGPLATFNFLYVPTYIAADGVTLTDAGYTLLTQMAKTALATYGLTIKSGYLADMLVGDSDAGIQSKPQANTAYVGSPLIFTPQAKWSDGVVRPMLNLNYDGMDGIWTSSNPAVMYVSQQGQAVALAPGQATISFKSASGVPFSPWVMTVSAALVND